VVLNTEGEYSSEPHQVLSARGEVVYDGLRLDGDAFALAHEWSRGTLHASLALEELLAQVRPGPGPDAPAEREPAQRPEKRHWSLLGLMENAKALSEGAGAMAGIAHAVLHLHVVIWLLGLLSATVAGLHLGGVFGTNARAAAGLAPASAFAAAPAPDGLPQGLSAIPPTAAGPVPAPAPPASNSVAAARTAASDPAASGADGSSPRWTLYGLDVSKWNGDWVDHLNGPLAGISFVFVRASDGLTADPSFGRHWSAVHSNGLVRGSYHFYRAAIDAEQQVQLYLRMLGGASGRGDIAPVLDFEAASLPPGAPPPKERVQADLLRALQLLEQQGGRLPMIYTNWDMGTKWLDDERFARYPLWIADWSQRHAPRLPATWARQGFRFWQRTDHYQLPSADRLAMDLDWFVGSREDLVR
jgi:GH25 family lysozyme M1 (1,4-beta-N-acetylmuramidase)